MNRNKAYGVSSKFDFGKWDHKVYKFQSEDQAEKWLNEEERDFRERELMSKTAATKLAGKNAVDNAVDFSEELAMRELF